jgi:CHASE3 domain sensor protein
VSGSLRAERTRWQQVLLAWLRLPVRRRWRLIAVFCLAGGLIVTEIVLAYQTTVSNTAADAAVAYTLRVVTLTSHTQKALGDMQAGYRGYLLTGDDSYLAEYSTSRQSTHDLLVLLERQTARNSAQVGRWQSIDQQLTDWESQVTEPTIERRRALTGGAISQLIPVVVSQDDPSTPGGWRSSSTRSLRRTLWPTPTVQNEQLRSETRSSTSSARLLDSAVASGDSAIKRSARGKRSPPAFVTRSLALNASTHYSPATCA